MAKDDKHGNRRLDADDVLAGRGKPPSARDLIELIRATNPTGLELKAKDTARRYALKSRLQSLLIDRFAEDLEVEAPGREPGVVGLRHRPLDMHACHVPLGALDHDARSWVQAELDRKAFDEAHPPAVAALGKRGDDGLRRPAAPDSKASRDWDRDPDRAELTAADQVRRGQEAVDAYDYERAREHLTRALTLASGDVEAALPLLALLVDHLAADDEALGVEAHLSPAARKHPEARLLLGLAAARSGQRERAKGLLEGHRGARSVEPFLVLARAALASGDVEAVTHDLAAVRERDPIHPDLRDLEGALAARRAQERLPLEAALTGLLEGGHVDDAEPRARALLARFPDSEVARRVLRTLEEVRKATQTRQLLADAEEAAARAELTLALSLLGQALAAGPRGEQLAPIQARVEEIKATLRDRAEHAEVEKAIALLGDRDRLPGLLAYLALTDPQRSRVRARVALPHFAWLSEIGSSERPRAAALAVIALERAGSLVAEAPQAALERLDEHERTLRSVGHRAEIELEARARLGTLRRETAARRIEEARVCFEEGALERAEALLAPELLGDLDEKNRARCEQLRARIAPVLERRLLVATFEKRRREGALLSARDAADALLAREGEPERERWAAIQGELGAEIRKAFRLRVDATPRPVRSLRHIDLENVSGVPRLLRPGGRVAPFVQTSGRWVFVRVIDLASRIEQARILLSTPAPLELLGTQVDGDRLVVVGTLGAVLELDLTDGNILGWYESAAPERREPTPDRDTMHGDVDLSAHEEVIDDAVLVPGTRLLWRVVQNARARRRSVHIVDLARRRIVRELGGSTGRVFLALLVERKEPLMVVVSYDDETLVFHDRRGAPLRDGKLAIAAIPWGIVVAPRGEQIVIFTGGRKNKKGGTDTSLRWCTYTPGVGASPEQTVEGVGGRDFVAVADRASGLIHLWNRTSADDSDANELRALRIDDGDPRAPGATLDAEARPPSLEQLFCVPISPRTVLLQNSQHPGVIALVPTDDDLEVAELGPDPPPFRPATPIGHIRIKTMNNATMRCEKPTGARGAAVKALVAMLHHEPRAAWVRRWQAIQQEGDVGRMIEMSFALRQLRERTEAASINKWLSVKFPDHPEARLIQAGPLANVGRWSEVADLLFSVDPHRLDEGAARHLHHLLGLALLNLGEMERARRVFERGATFEGGSCELAMLLAIATPLSESPAAPALAWTQEQIAVRKVVAAIEEADACLDRRDAAGATRALEVMLVTETGEVQSLARRAECLLLIGDTADEGLFEKACALAWFCAAHAEKKPYLRRELPIPRRRWETARLDDLAARAARWLDATLGEAWPEPAGGL
jgi:hypothetical protein